MARCCGGTNSTLIQAAEHIEVTGTGSSQDPYVIHGDVALGVSDNSTFNLTLSGLGTEDLPWVLSLAYASTAKLDDLPDVNASAPTNAQVLGWDSATSKWTARAPTTAASGSVTHDTSLDGDGSGGAPLAVAEDPDGFLTTTTDGVGLSNEGKNSLVRHYGNALSRSADPLSPNINTVTMLDDTPGVQFYWTGTQWKPVSNGLVRDIGPEFMALSGPYVDGRIITMLTRQVVTVTDAVGNFDIISALDLSGAAGVLAVNFQETGSVPYKAMVFENIDRVSATAYRLDDGTAYPAQAISGITTAYIY